MKKVIKEFQTHAKHTKGKFDWNGYLTEKGKITHYYVYLDEPGLGHMYTSIARTTGQPLAQQRANARLFAASQDLLEACKLALRDMCEANAYRSGTVDLLEAAIAKAEGNVGPKSNPILDAVFAKDAKQAKRALTKIKKAVSKGKGKKK